MILIFVLKYISLVDVSFSLVLSIFFFSLVDVSFPFDPFYYFFMFSFLFSVYLFILVYFFIFVLCEVHFCSQSCCVLFLLYTEICSSYFFKLVSQFFLFLDVYFCFL
jgi:hypothetical protein